VDANSKIYFRALGKYITELRKQHKMTQAELSRLLGVSQQSVFAIEMADRRVSVLMMIKLAKIFDVPVESLIGMIKSLCTVERRLSPAGVRHAECYQKLSKTEQRFVKRIIDTLLERVAAQGAVAGA
jgi:transcriptional regulator with XRE-family HTH domain